jgi:hypothetical protein
MIYVDDSGSEASGLIVYGWIECDPVRWRYALRALLELRKRLYREHQVPPAEELHATKFVNGRSRIATAGSDSDPEGWKTLGRSVAVRCLETIAGCPDIKVGAVYRRTTLRGRGYYEERGRVYVDLVTLWNDGHRATGSHAFVSMDGNGTDPNYVNAHRSLPLDDRHIIEDPMFHDSKRSQLVQMADLVAYTTFVSLNRHPGNVFAWDWREKYLDRKDVNGGARLI